MGGDDEDDKEAVILGRIVRWREWGLEFEADRRHRIFLMEHFGFSEESGASGVNGDRERKEEKGEEEEMGMGEATKFRGLAARMNFVAQDSLDLQYPAKEVAREMARPRVGAWKRLKKAVRYMLGREAVIWKYELQEEREGFKV